MEVYRTTNLIDGKQYIGMTVKTGASADAYLGSGTRLMLAVKKHGQAAFKREVLETCDTYEELCAAEIRLIAEHNAVADPMYYNITVGGEGVGDSHVGLRWTQEQRDAMSETVRGENSHFFGKTGAECHNSFTWTVVRDGESDEFLTAPPLMEKYDISMPTLIKIRNYCETTGEPYESRWTKLDGLFITSEAR